MIALDTDHVSVFKYRSGPRYESLVRRIEQSGEVPGTTIVSVEEYMRGWTHCLPAPGAYASGYRRPPRRG